MTFLFFAIYTVGPKGLIFLDSEFSQQTVRAAVVVEDAQQDLLQPHQVQLVGHHLAHELVDVLFLQHSLLVRQLVALPLDLLLHLHDLVALHLEAPR